MANPLLWPAASREESGVTAGGSSSSPRGRIPAVSASHSRIRNPHTKYPAGVRHLCICNPRTISSKIRWNSPFVHLQSAHDIQQESAASQPVGPSCTSSGGKGKRKREGRSSPAPPLRPRCQSSRHPLWSSARASHLLLLLPLTRATSRTTHPEQQSWPRATPTATYCSCCRCCPASALPLPAAPLVHALAPAPRYSSSS